MSDRILIKSLQVAATVGVPDLERVAPQRLEIDVELSGDFRGLADDLSRTTDYAAVAAWLRAECGRVEFRLIESLADHLAHGLLAAFPGTSALALEIRKHILADTGHVGVRVERDRTGKNS